MPDHSTDQPPRRGRPPKEDGKANLTRRWSPDVVAIIRAHTTAQVEQVIRDGFASEDRPNG